MIKSNVIYKAWINNEIDDDGMRRMMADDLIVNISAYKPIDYPILNQSITEYCIKRLNKTLMIEDESMTRELNLFLVKYTNVKTYNDLSRDLIKWAQETYEKIGLTEKVQYLQKFLDDHSNNPNNATEFNDAMRVTGFNVGHRKKAS